MAALREEVVALRGEKVHWEKERREFMALLKDALRGGGGGGAETVAGSRDDQTLKLMDNVRALRDDVAAERDRSAAAARSKAGVRRDRRRRVGRR